MKLHRRVLLQLAVGVAALLAGPHIAQAQSYPTRTVRLVVGFPPGGSADIIARLVAPVSYTHLTLPTILRV